MHPTASPTTVRLTPPVVASFPAGGVRTDSVAVAMRNSEESESFQRICRGYATTHVLVLLLVTVRFPMVTVRVPVVTVLVPVVTVRTAAATFRVPIVACSWMPTTIQTYVATTLVLRHAHHEPVAVNFWASGQIYLLWS